MNHVVQPMFIKFHARRAMNGKFFKTLFATSIPTLVMTGVMLLIMLIPSVKESIDMISNGIFESVEEQQLYIINVLNNLIYCMNFIAVLFNFLTVGAKKFCLNVIVGKEAKIKDVFSLYDKWYIALIYPFVTVLVCLGLDALSLAGQNLPIGVMLLIEGFIMFVQLALFFVEIKMSLLYYALAENNCSSFIGAVKHSWKLTNFKTVVSIFLLYISFIGWFIFAFFTTGVALIYAYPYLEMSMATLYLIANNPPKVNKAE